VVVVDAVNTDYERLAFERGEIEKFLRATKDTWGTRPALAVVTDTGTQMEEGFSTDGNALSGGSIGKVRRGTARAAALQRFLWGGRPILDFLAGAEE